MLYSVILVIFDSPHRHNYEILLLEAMLINFPLWQYEFQCILRWIHVQKNKMHRLKCDGSETLLYIQSAYIALLEGLYMFNKQL